MSVDGRTVWWAKDAAWWRREAVVELLEEVGCAGPCVVDWLACEAKAQNAGGVVKAGERTIARALNIELVTVGHVLSAAVTVGLLDDFERDGRTFTCRISGWRSEQERALGAARKARSREKSAVSHGPSRSVTPCPEMSTTGQDSTEVTTTPKPPSKGAVKFDRKVVPADVHETATSILEDFNRQAGTGYGALTGSGQPSEALKRILGALRDHPTLDAPKAARIVTLALGRPFWEGKPQPGVVFGPGVVAKHLEDVSVAPSLSVVERVARLNAAGEAA